MNRLHRTPSSRDHDECTNHEERRVHRHQRPPLLCPHGAEVVPHPHVRLHLDADDRCEERTDEGQQVVEEGDRFGNDEADGAGEQDARAWVRWN